MGVDISIILAEWCARSELAQANAVIPTAARAATADRLISRSFYVYIRRYCIYERRDVYSLIARHPAIDRAGNRERGTRRPIAGRRLRSAAESL
jgi:hypothetical protein